MHEIDRTRNQSLETLRAHNPIVKYKCAYSGSQFKTSSENLPGACRMPTGDRPKRPMPARLLSPTWTGRGYISDGHRQAPAGRLRVIPFLSTVGLRFRADGDLKSTALKKGREKRRSRPLACREKRRSRPLRPWKEMVLPASLIKLRRNTPTT
ncbi:hypothetical protein Bbelb_272690 [Branchiostoma belcheri]|nr:hypothetical protein Bbelb_272690 [Branchiostoma belcheri]